MAREPRVMISLFATGRPTEWVSLREGATPLQVIAVVNRQTSWTAVTLWGLPVFEAPGTYGRGMRILVSERTV